MDDFFTPQSLTTFSGCTVAVVVVMNTLRHALDNRELDDARSVEAAAQILEGLAHAHERGIVHRDIKPSNVLLADRPDMESPPSADISVRLLDFGLALVTEEETLTAAGDVPGTLAYISPERLQGKEALPSTDVWSTGVLLWEALAHRHPFGGGRLVPYALGGCFPHGPMKKAKAVELWPSSSRCEGESSALLAAPPH